MAVTLALAFAGGGAFAYAGMPAGWLSGALVACAVAALAGVPVEVNRRVRDANFMVLGTSMGSAITPETLQGIATWPLTMGILLVSLPVMMLASGFYLERMARWDRRSAFFASAPGALSAVLIMAETAGADVRRVVFGQSLRLFVLVAVLPAAMGGLGHQPAGSLPINPVTPDLYNLVLSLAVGIAGGLAAEKLRFPGGAMVGAMLASGALHGSGLAEGRLPDILLIIGFVVLGANSGGRFAGTSMATLQRFLVEAFVALIIATSVALVFAVAASWLADEPLPEVVLAFVPGALEAMTIMAFVLGADPAFVAAHHLARFLALSLVLPLIVRLLFGPAAVPAEGVANPDEEKQD